MSNNGINGESASNRDFHATHRSSTVVLTLEILTPSAQAHPGFIQSHSLGTQKSSLVTCYAFLSGEAEPTQTNMDLELELVHNFYEYI